MDPIVFLPGVPGSSLNRTGGLFPVQVWGSFGSAFAKYDDLTINPDGTDLRPLVQPASVITGPRTLFGLNLRNVVGYYGDFRDGMQDRGWSVLLCPVDWRRSAESQVPSLLQRVLTLTGGRPFHLVTHSQGHRFGRWLYQQFGDVDTAFQVLTVVEIAPPVLGAWAMVENLMGDGDVIRALALIENARAVLTWGPLGATGVAIVEGSARQRVLRMMWSLPGLLELLPSDAGEQDDGRRNDAAAVWSRNFWPGNFSWVTQDALNAAHVAAVRFAGLAIPQEKHFVLFSRGISTLESIQRFPQPVTSAVIVQRSGREGDGQVDETDLGHELANYREIVGDHSAMMGAQFTHDVLDAILRRTTPPAAPTSRAAIAGDQLPILDGPPLPWLGNDVLSESMQMLYAPPAFGFVPPSPLPPARVAAPIHCPEVLPPA